MKQLFIIFGLGLSLAAPSWLLAQQTYNSPTPSQYHLNHGEIGVYADYFHFAPGNYNNNYVGVGGRVSFNVQPNLALEAEMNYDFARNFTTTYDNGANTSFATTSVRPLSGFFGPKFQIGRSSPIRAFVDGKIGFINFSTNTSGLVTGSTFTGAVTGVGGAGTHLAFFPGGGIEGFIGPIGMRLDVGDEIYLNDGTYNNLRVTLGPIIRF